jgi:hypothetical protein
MLIAAATKAPDDPSEAAKLVWDAYYGNHQKNEAFRRLKVADIFMGGGVGVHGIGIPPGQADRE